MGEVRKSQRLLLSESTPSQGNFVVWNAAHGRSEPSRRASLELVHRIMNQAFFDELRTKQQTGYIVQGSMKSRSEHLYSHLLIQSSVYQPHDLLARIEEFVADFSANFKEKVSKEKFEAMRSIALNDWKELPHQQAGMRVLLHSLAFSHKDFEWRDKVSEGFKTLTYKSFLDEVQQYLNPENEMRTAILIHGKTEEAVTVPFTEEQKANSKAATFEECKSLEEARSKINYTTRS